MNRNSSDSEHSSNKRRSQERSRSRSKERRKDQETRDRKIKIKIPDLSTYLYTLKQFTFLQTEKINSETIQKGYDKYRKQWEQHQNQEFINEYKKDCWFNEKYNPELLDLNEKQKRENIKKIYSDFVAKFDSGFFDKIDLRVVGDISQIGTVAQLDQQEESQYISSNFINNQTLQVNLNNSCDITKSPYFGYDLDHCTLFIRSVSKQISRYDIKTIVEKLEGYKGITMSDPLRKANFTRNCWIQFDCDENCNKASLSLNGIMIKNEAVNVSRAYTKVKRIKVLKNYPSTRLQIDISTMTKLIMKFDEHTGVEGNQIYSKLYPTPQNKFDVLLTYLRKVHAFDYFTGCQFQNERVLTLRTGAVFLRIEADYQQLPEMQTVFKKIQQNAENKVAEMTAPPEYMALVKNQIEKFVIERQQNKSEGVWKCMICEKKFKTSDFLAKHMLARHDQIKIKKLQVVMQQLYLKDPNKITNYSIRDQSKIRKNFGGGFRREKRREVYRDFDEPEEVSTVRAVVKPIVNFLDI